MKKRASAGSIGTLALTLLAGGCAMPVEAETELGTTTQGLSSTSFYLRCNSTGWGADSTNRMVGTGVVVLEYSIASAVVDSCEVMQGDSTNPWWPNPPTFFLSNAAPATLAVPVAAPFRTRADNTDPHFNVAYASAGRYRASFDTATKVLTIGPATAAGSVACGGSACNITGANVCCHDRSANSYSCTSACAAGNDPSFTALKCDGNEDCSGGTICCATSVYVSNATSCVLPAACVSVSNYVANKPKYAFPVCSSPADCAAGTACTSNGFYTFPEVAICK